MSHTPIEWTRPPGFRGETWNPTLGCSKVSRGCKRCYAIRSVRRMSGNPNAKIAAANAGLVVLTGSGLNWTGKINLLPDRLTIPIKRKIPTCWFVNSLSDLFHEEIPDEFIDQVFAVMALCQWHQFKVLTKRDERMLDYFMAGMSHNDARRRIQDVLDSMGERACADSLIDNWPLPNVHLGVSVEDCKTAAERSVVLRKVPATVRFISQEPQVESIRWKPEMVAGIHQIIQGGESGPDSGPFNIQWALDTKSDCEAAGVPWFFKQAGANVVAPQCGLMADVHFPRSPRMERVGDDLYRVYLKDKKGGDLEELPSSLRVRSYPQPVISVSANRSDEFHDPEPEK